MSHVSSRGEQSTSTEIAVLAALTNLAVSGADEAIQKTGATTFANVSVGTGSGLFVETPELVSGNTYSVTRIPKWVVLNGSQYFEDDGYTRIGLEITFISQISPAPGSTIRAVS